ncbi:MAG: hypothetical protein P1V21_15770 [Rhizobiaceae bacterium]|nr:hypothetical protein [Rhizobiaceae bacterium]
MFNRPITTGFAAFFTLLAATQFSAAVDANDFANKLVAAYAVQGNEISYGSATAEDDQVTITQIVGRMPGKSEGLNFGDFVFNGVVEDGSGGYDIASVTEDDLDWKFGNVRVTFADILYTDVKIPGNPSYGSLDSLLQYATASTGQIIVQIDDRELLSVSKSLITNSINADRQGLEFGYQVDGFQVNLDSIETSSTKDLINGMGYGKINGNAILSGDWNTQTGKLNLSEYSMTLEDVGRLDVKLAISGLSWKFVEGLQQLSEQMRGKEDDPKSQQAMGIAALGMLQQLSLYHVSLRFDDASLTNRILDAFAKQRGIDREKMIQGLKGTLPFALAALQNAEFQQQVSSAVGAFLDNPESIEIAVEPASPLSFAVITGSAISAPQTLPEVLGLTVKANE